jgi:hypothetical protein
MTGDTEEQLLANAKKHGMEVHGYSEEKWNEDREVLSLHGD